MLSQKLTHALASASDVTRNFYLTRMGPALNEVENAASQSTNLSYYVEQLDALLDDPNFAVKPRLTNKFAQALGEAHFFVMCERAGAPLRRIPEIPNVKTPDFESIHPPGRLHYEVKTLSVVDGEIGVERSLAEALDAQIDIERQRDEGREIAIGESTVSPYAGKVHRDKILLGATQVLIEKARQNIKADQFARPNTFLVLNLSMLPPIEGNPRVLRPSYPESRLFPTSITGQLWAVGFGRPDMIVQSEPEFEGKPCVEGELAKLGILVDPDFEPILGILFVVHNMNAPAQIWALFRDVERLREGNPEVADEINKLAGTAWNDYRDHNGWQLS